jgi:hypothetical protein
MVKVGGLMMPFPNDERGKEAVIHHFKRRKKGFTYDEDTFIGIIQNPKSSKYDVYWSVLGLRDVGTEKCVPFLKQLQDYPMQDVKDCSILTIAHLVGSAETDYYVSILEQKGKRKDFPMWAIIDSANEKAIEPVLSYLEGVYKKWRQPKCDYAGDAYLDGLLYLSKYIDGNVKIKEMFDKFISIKEKLPEGAKQRFRQEVPYFKSQL